MSLPFEMHRLMAEREAIPADRADLLDACDRRMLDALARSPERTRGYLRDHCTREEFAVIAPLAADLFHRTQDAEMACELIRAAERLCDEEGRKRLKAMMDDAFEEYASQRRADHGIPGTFDTGRVRAIITKRMATVDEADWLVEECWAELVTALAQDQKGTEWFLLTECTDDELSWIGEALDELVWATQSPRLIKAYRTAIRLHPREARKYDLDGNLDTAIRSRLVDQEEARRLIAWRPEGITGESRLP